MLKPALIVLVTLAVSPALASATPWQEIAPDVRARLISSDTVAGGTLLAGLELDMPAGTNTYWRIPGETGIPTELDFSASTGLDAPEVLWPYPEIDLSKGYHDYVFRGRLVLPVRLAVADGPAVLDATIALGICSDMCVPATAHFALPLTLTAPDPAQALRLDQALAAVPIAWDRPGEAMGNVSLGPGGALVIAGLSPAIDPHSLIADLGDPAILFATPQKSPDNGVWTLQPLGGDGASGYQGHPVQLTFNTSSGPYIVTRTVMPAAP